MIEQTDRDGRNGWLSTPRVWVDGAAAVATGTLAVALASWRSIESGGGSFIGRAVPKRHGRGHEPSR